MKLPAGRRTPYLTTMNKTSVYPDDEHVARLKQAAEAEGRSRAEIVRDAIAMYTDRLRLPRTFAMAGVVSVPGLSAAELGCTLLALNRATTTPCSTTTGSTPTSMPASRTSPSSSRPIVSGLDAS